MESSASCRLPKTSGLGRYWSRGEFPCRQMVWIRPTRGAKRAEMGKEMELLAAHTVSQVVHARDLRNIDEWLRDQLNYGTTAPTAAVFAEFEKLSPALDRDGRPDPIKYRLALFLFAHAAEHCTPG